MNRLVLGHPAADGTGFLSKENNSDLHNGKLRWPFGEIAGEAIRFPHRGPLHRMKNIFKGYSFVSHTRTQKHRT